MSTKNEGGLSFSSFEMLNWLCHAAYAAFISVTELLLLCLACSFFFFYKHRHSMLWLSPQNSKAYMMIQGSLKLLYYSMKRQQ